MSSQAEAADADVATAETFERIDRISHPSLLEKYDTFLLDMWGGKIFLYSHQRSFYYEHISCTFWQ